MYRFYINGIKNEYHFAELCRLFMDDHQFEVIPFNSPGINSSLLGEDSYLFNSSGSQGREEIKRKLYEVLSDITGAEMPWGTLTGVRPLKLAFQIALSLSYGDETTDQKIGRTRAEMKDKYLISDSKLDLLMDILRYQLDNVPAPDTCEDSLYVGIPFCPTRCSYCSFASNTGTDGEIETYLDNLISEIEYTGSKYKQAGRKLESVYIGGGTPTTLNPEQLERLITSVYNNFRIEPGSIEFTVEAGRPDTITQEKMDVLKSLGIDRISINPQSMKKRTMELIGRSHGPEQIREAFKIAEKTGFKTINSDLIAGLPEETAEDFTRSLQEIIELGASNITIHTLSVKHGSRLKQQDPEYFREKGRLVTSMLEKGSRMLYDSGYLPYYIYRQKHQTGGHENVGWCKPGTHSIYNIRIMEEKQTIIALGAGAIGKIYFPERDGLERVANVSNFRIYTERFEEILKRKDQYFTGTHDSDKK